jgi:DNA replicative helicase MCM subunit Mcm2 (Cdc46/Mcm family)
MKESLFDTMADDSGVVDFSRTSGTSKAKELRKLKSLLYKVAEEECNNLFKSEEIYDIATSNGIPGTMVEELIESLNSVDQCLLKKPQRTWQLTGTSTVRPSQAPIGSARGRGSRY